MDVVDDEWKQIFFTSVLHHEKQNIPSPFLFVFGEHLFDRVFVVLRQGDFLQVDVLTLLRRERDDVVEVMDISLVVPVEVCIQDVLHEHLEFVHGHLLGIPLGLLSPRRVSSS